MIDLNALNSFNALQKDKALYKYINIATKEDMDTAMFQQYKLIKGTIDWFDIAPAKLLEFDLPTDFIDIDPTEIKLYINCKMKVNKGIYKVGDILRKEYADMIYSYNENVGFTVIFRNNKIILDISQTDSLFYGVNKVDVQLQIKLESWINGIENYNTNK